MGCGFLERLIVWQCQQNKIVVFKEMAGAIGLEVLEIVLLLFETSLVDLIGT